MDVDFFNPEAWQPSVVRAVDKQVAGWDVSGSELFAMMLTTAKTHRDHVSQLQLSNGDEQPSRYDCFRHRMAGHRGGGFRDSSRAPGGPRRRPSTAVCVQICGAAKRLGLQESGKERYATGDGTVHLRGAIPPFLDESRVVCVAPRDFGYWEVRDRALASAVNFHGLLPTMNMVHRLIVRFLLGRDDRYGNTWGRRLPGVEEWRPPLALREKK